MLLSNCDFYGARVGVADRIVHRLLHQPVDAPPVFVGQAVDGFVGGDHHVEFSALAGFARMPVQRQRQTEVVQHRWSEQQRQVSHLAHRLFRQALDRIEVFADAGRRIRAFGAFRLHQDRRYSLRPDALKALQVDSAELRDILKDYPNYKLTVEGHADERGSAEYNIALGDRRAGAAKEYLVADQLEVLSYGKEKPVCQQHEGACWQRNRRIHIVAAAQPQK